MNDKIYAKVRSNLTQKKYTAKGKHLVINQDMAARAGKPIVVWPIDPTKNSGTKKALDEGYTHFDGRYYWIKEWLEDMKSDNITHHRAFIADAITEGYDPELLVVAILESIRAGSETS